MSKPLTTPQLIFIERLLGKECTLQGTPRKRTRTFKQNQKLGIPREHSRALLEVQHRNTPMSSKLQDLLLKLYDQETQNLNTNKELL